MGKDLEALGLKIDFNLVYKALRFQQTVCNLQDRRSLSQAGDTDLTPGPLSRARLSHSRLWRHLEAPC
jgi:hypothetical protein